MNHTIFTSILPTAVRDFTINILLLFGLVFLYQISRFRPQQKGWVKNSIVGLAVGGFAILIMSFPFTFQAGLIFDARSVLFVISGYFFGPIVTIIGSLIGAAYRISIGGNGVYAGVATILATSLIGVIWAPLERKLPVVWPQVFKFYLMGFLAHIVTLICQLLIFPISNAIDALRTIAIPFLVVYPIATMIIAISIDNHKKRLLADMAIRAQKLLLQSSIDSASEMEIYALDTEYNYLTFNRFHEESMTRYYGRSPNSGDNFFAFVSHEAFRLRLKREFDRALNGEAHTSEAEIEVEPGKFFESHYNPIIDEHRRVVGVSVFAQDITRRIQDANQIIHMSYHDSLTGLKNRRFYQEEIERLGQLKSYKETFVLLDINGLKVMNDAFGHGVGDLLLTRVTAIIQKKLPDKSEFMRIGGDEFLIIFYELGENEVNRLVDDIDRELKNSEINGINFSVSFGVQGHSPRETIIDTIRGAEKRMYTKKLSEVTSSRHETIRAILNTLHVKSQREESHSARVALICEKIGEALHLRREEIELLTTMANLHDIGKIAVDQAILDKPGPLTDREWSEIKKHPETGYHILLVSPEYAEIAEDILSHHARYDGKGYPRGLKGSDIPLRARIISVADSYDAMTSARPYRPPLGLEEAYREIERNAGTQFDPQIAAVFLNLLRNGHADL